MKIFLKKIISSYFFLSVFFVSLFIFHAPKIEAATVTLSPTSGVAGQIVTITGTAFDNSSTATITWDGTTLTTTPSTVTTSASGAIPASGTVSFVVPAAMYGAHTVQVNTGATNVVVTTFTINTPAVAISSPSIPTAGLPPGVTLTVTATNLESSKLTTFYFDDIAVGTSTSTTNGTAELVFNIPDVANPGAHIIKASNSTYAVANTTVVIASPAITLNPATSAVGTQVTISGSNLKANTAVSFFLNGTSLSTDTSVTTNGAGSFTTTFTVPNAFAGANTVKAQTSTNLFANATLTVSTPALTLSPATGTGGLAVTASGTGFRANSTVDFYINGSKISTNASTNSLGAFQISFTFPGDFPTGAQTIRAQTDSVNFATATYTVVASAVTAAPATGAPGTRVTLTGTNFDPNKAVTFKWNGDVIKPIEETITTNSAGSFVANLIIPANYVSGTGQFESSTSSVSTVITAFTIANPTLTVAPATGLPGAKISVSGANFEGNQTLTLLWDDTVITTTPKVVTTTPLGSFVAVFTVPNTSRGVHYVSAAAGTKKINFTASFTITAPAVTLSTSSIQSSSSLSISGTGFLPYQPVTFLWDNIKSLQSNIDEIKADASGYFSAGLIIPVDAAAGTHVIKAKSNDSVFVDSTITVTTGEINLSKNSGTGNSKIQISGTNFDVESAVKFTWDGVPLKTNKVKTDTIGGFNTTITIPPSNPGSHTLGASTGKFNTAVSEFTINPPSLTIDPNTARAGDTITVTGSDFLPGKTVEVTISKILGVTKSKPITIDQSGNFTTSMKMPFIFGNVVTISALVDERNVASIANYPIVHGALYNTLAKAVKYLLILLAACMFIAAIIYTYKVISNNQATISMYLKKIIARLLSRIHKVRA